MLPTLPRRGSRKTLIDSPLFTACKTGNILEFNRLLNSSSKYFKQLNNPNAQGLTCLHIAVLGGHLEIVQALLRQNVDVNKPQMLGQTAVHLAALRGDVNVARAVIAAGSPNIQDKDGRTPLHLAANSDIVNLLMQRGANPNIKANNNQTPIDSAISANKHPSVIDAMRSRGGMSGQTSNISNMVNQTWTVDFDGTPFTNYDFYIGFTPREQLENHPKLRQPGSIVVRNSKNKVVFTIRPLNGGELEHILCQNNGVNWSIPTQMATPMTGVSLRIILSLLSENLTAKQPAVTNYDDSNDYRTRSIRGPDNRIHIAARNGNLTQLQQLVTPRNINHQYQLHMTALATACQYNHVAAARWLLANNASMTLVDDARQTPLHYAAQTNNPHLIQALVLRGADLTARDINGARPFDLASKQNPAVLKLLEPPAASTGARLQQALYSNSSGTKSNSLARQWGIDREPCFWPTSAAEAKLRGQAPGTYLVRPSSQEGKMTLAVVSLDGNIERFLFSMVRPGYWMCGVGAGAEYHEGNFDSVVRKVACSGHPLVNPDLVVNVTDQKSDGPITLGNMEDLVPRQNFGGQKPQVYGNIKDALKNRVGMNENAVNVVENQTVWRGVARSMVVGSMDPQHNDIDGMSLAFQDYYHFNVDTFLANKVLAGQRPGSFLVRRSAATERSFACSLVTTKNKVEHILIQPLPDGGVAAVGGNRHNTVRELISANKAFFRPLHRSQTSTEFVECDLIIGRAVGKGQGGAVYHASMTTGDCTITVALKQIDQSSLINQKDSQELSEAEIMLNIPPHRNVNMLYGVVLQPSSLMTEFCDGGSLDAMLGLEADSNAQARVFTMPECHQLALGIARGIAHLHSCPIIHRDIAARNILIQSPLIPKVADFGMSRLIANGDETIAPGAGAGGWTSTKMGPVKWQAPEQLGGDKRVFNEATDTFSFAVTLTEIIGNCLPWNQKTNVEAAVAVARYSERTYLHPRTSPALKAVIEQCWEQDARNRPKMNDVVAMLEQPSYASPAPPINQSLYDDTQVAVASTTTTTTTSSSSSSVHYDRVMNDNYQ